MNIVICIDDNFLMQACTFITSLIYTNKENINLFVISEKLSDLSKKEINNIISGTNISVNFIFIDLESLPPLPLEGKNHISIATYYRLLIPFVLPKTISKVLYVDCDMIMLDSLEELYNTDLSSYCAGVVIDMFNDDIEIPKRLLYNEKVGYFNAGMLLINLDNWRSEKTSEKAIEFISNHPEKCLAHDQDALNHSLNGNYTNVSTRYNLQLDFLCDFSNLIVDEKHFDDILQARINPCIIHFTGPTKPWLKNCNHPYKILWNYFQNKTKWKNFPKKYEYKKYRLFKFLIKRFLIKIKICKDDKPFLKETYKQAKLILKKIKKQEKYIND